MQDNAKTEMSHVLSGKAKAICYSGYRQGQNPQAGIYPSYTEVLEDLRILQPNWQLLRLYDAGPHAHTTLEVIKREKLPFKVLLGMDLGAEENNPGCPWGAFYSDHELSTNRCRNDLEIERVVRLANDYREHVLGISIGNEASVEWTDHKVSTMRLVDIARTLRSQTDAPLTFCENYVPWASGQLDALAAELDWIALHTYPLWEAKTIDDALGYTQQNYDQVKQRFADKPVIITEAGWATAANGRGFPAEHASPEWQSEYCQQLLRWSEHNQVLTFLFEAFDEAWKGSSDPLEPEKHWGIYHIDRTPKPVVGALV